MTEHDGSRRAFLIGTVAGAGAAAARVDLAQGQPAAEHAHDTASKLGAFLNQEDSAASRRLHRAAHAGRTRPAGGSRCGRAQLYRPRACGRLCGLAGLLSARLCGARRPLPQDLQPVLRPAHHRAAGCGDHSDGRRQGRGLHLADIAGSSSTCCAPTRWKACSRTRSTAATRISPAGGWSDSPGAQPVFTAADMESREAFTRGPILGLQAQARRS